MSGGAVSIGGYLSWDHDRLDAILYAVCAFVDRDEIAEAAVAYDDFGTGLARHVRLEEELLFEPFERITGVSGVTAGPTVVLREEHQRILAAATAMRSALAAGDAPAFRRAHADLRAVLPSHHAKEEQVLYVILDQSLAEPERSELARRVREAP